MKTISSSQNNWSKHELDCGCNRGIGPDRRDREQCGRWYSSGWTGSSSEYPSRDVQHDCWTGTTLPAGWVRGRDHPTAASRAETRLTRRGASERLSHADIQPDDVAARELSRISIST